MIPLEAYLQFEQGNGDGSPVAQYLNCFLGAPGIHRDSVIPGVVVVVTLPDRKHRQFSLEDRQGIIQYAQQVMKSQNVYITMTLQDMALNKGIGQKGENKERSKEAASCMFGVWVDIDLRNDSNAHKADNLPNREEWFGLQNALGLRPSMVVDSGNGYHLYLQFSEPLHLVDDSDREWAAKLVGDFQLWIRKEMTKEGKRNGAEKGWKVDSTADLPRILRVPGTLNHKTAPPKAVTLHTHHPEVRYNAQALRTELDQLLEEQAEPTTIGKSDPTKPRTKRNREKDPKEKPQEAPANDQPESTADADLIKADCAWVEHCFGDAAALPEPDWYQLGTILGRCKDGDQLYHDWSKPHQDYTYEEVEEKLRHGKLAPGPVTCEFIHRELGFEGCDDCLHRGSIKSPITLGTGRVLRAIFPDCPVHLVIPSAYAINRQGIFTFASKE